VTLGRGGQVPSLVPWANIIRALMSITSSHMCGCNYAGPCFEHILLQTGVRLLKLQHLTFALNIGCVY
jgi:hypothetical protein